MKSIVLITGDLAAGKSTLAESLSKKTGFICIKKDLVKEKICDAVGFSNRKQNRNISIASVEAMVYFTQESLKSDKSVIAEANFRLDEIEQFRKVAKENKAKIDLIYLYGDYNILYERFLARIPTRHKAHLSIGLDKSINKFIEYINSIREDIKDENAFRINATKLDQKGVLNKTINHLKDIKFIG